MYILYYAITVSSKRVSKATNAITKIYLLRLQRQLKSN